MKKTVPLLTSLLLSSMISTPALAYPGMKGPKPTQEHFLLKKTRQVTLSGKRSGEGYFHKSGNKMIFQSERQADNPFYQMYIMDFEEGDIHRISPGYGKTTCGWIHPNGKQALFASTHADPHSKNLQQAEIDFRNSGKKRRYSWDFDSHYDIYESNLDGKGLKNLTKAKGYDAEGAYSPDGKQIVFASNRQAYQPGLSAKEKSLFKIDPSSMMEIYIMNSDGSNLKRLTDHDGYDGGPFFSADGKKITWRRFSKDGTRAEIYTMNTDGSNKKQLTHMGVMSWAPYFHPSGDYLIFATNKHGFGNFELYLVATEGESKPVRVTYTKGFDGLPVFSPDGKQLSWTSNRSGKSSQIFLADWDDLKARELLGLSQGPDLVRVPRKYQHKSTYEITASDLKKHIYTLASDPMDGRLTGTAGEQKAGHYLASYFQHLGLEPAGSKGSYFQPFEFTSGASVKLGSELKSKGEKYALKKVWQPLAFSQTGTFKEAPVVFAGYGIQAPKMGKQEEYDSYVHLDVKDKWVMVLRYYPENASAELKKQLSRYASLQYKAMVARNKGAKGLIVVSGPLSKVKSQLVPFKAGSMSGKTSLFGVSVDDQTAKTWLAKKGKDLEALQATLDKGDMVQGFDLPLRLSGNIDILTEKKVGYNILARLNVGAKLELGIGAHYDHLGRGSSGHSMAKSHEKGQVHYGADDNASGVAGVLELAEKFAHDFKSGRRKPKQNILFSLWSGEELGLIGSSYFVNQKKRKPMSAYINMDMIGRMDKALVLQGVGSSSIWKPLIERNNLKLGVPITLQSTSYLPTDATSFYLKKMPVLSAFTGAHVDYHSPRDTADKIDYPKTETVVKLVYRIARSVAKKDSKPDYIEMKKPKSQGKRGLRVYLGTIPDYVSGDVKGLKISGATKGGPAEKAGLKGGDIIVQLGQKKVENIYDYTYAIDALKIGVATTVVVIREGKRVSLKLTPGSRE